ncbi:large conductance mechanosensitive channel protein MscL [Simulacricoccus sp. 17bor-14]|nr:large conductance mechanosensitive channel protein MscL [Simulacricoccus sp. 17bor-14]
MVKEFREFAVKGNALQLAVAVVIGNAFTRIVTAVVDDLLMPLLNAVLPGGEWRAWTVSPLKLQLGHLLGAIVDFLLIALVLFLLVKKVLERFARAEPAPVAVPSTRACPECLEPVPLAARRCRACTSPLPTV